METVGAEDMSEDAESKVLGTLTTRAATLEKLVAIGFVQRRKKQPETGVKRWVPVSAALLKEGRVSISGRYSEKTGKAYDAVVLLDDTGGKYVNFKLEFPAKKGGR